MAVLVLRSSTSPTILLFSLPYCKIFLQIVRIGTLSFLFTKGFYVGILTKPDIKNRFKTQTMGLLTWVIFGLIAGALAKWIMPGPDPGGILVTILIGIAGAVVGGFIGSALGLGGVSGFDIGSLVIAVLGSLLLLWGYRKMK